MVLSPRPIFIVAISVAGIAGWLLAGERPAPVGPKPETYWPVDDVRAGMKGQGRTVMKGTKVETFDAEVLGVLKNTSPGRDLVLCKLSGLGLEKTGVIAGMSGSPIYIDGKLLGAVAYAWSSGKEPIAGVTPFSQMHGFVESYERRDAVEALKPARVGLRQPVKAGDKEYDTVTVSQSFEEPREADGLFLVPLRTPLAATGFSANSLKVLREQCGHLGLVPMQGGGTTAKVAEEVKDVALEPGGPLSISMITGDFDLSGIGTVTHIEGNRVYGWGHPFMGLGRCEFPLMTGYIHTVYPRQTISFKMGSPIKAVGVINADVSTGIAGWLGRKADMMPLRTTLQIGDKGTPKTFNVQIARQRSMMAPLVLTALTNSVDMEGEMPEEMTAHLQAKIEVEGRDPIVIKDTVSGVTGSRAPQALYGQVSAAVNLLSYNSFKPVRITRVECDAQVYPGRRTADVESLEVDSDTYEAGDTVKATVYLRPYKGTRQRIPVSLKLPADLAEGNYTLTACDDLAHARQTLRDNPTLNSPQNLDQLFESLNLQAGVKRTHLVVRVPVGANGVSVSGKAMTNLPGHMVQILGNGKRTGAQVVNGALSARQPTDWVIQGTDAVRFTVVKHSRALREDR